MQTQAVNAESHRELRREQRASVVKLITLLPWGDAGEIAEPRQVRLIDCSAHGLGFVDIVPMQPGEQFATQLHLDDDVTMVLYTVRHCAMVPPVSFKVGAELYGFVGAAENDADRVLSSLLVHGLI